MAELSVSTARSQGSSTIQDEDGDFEPSADMLVHDFDDEQTLEEEERLQGETNFSAEIDDLTREGEIPIHELLKLYGYGREDSAEEEDEGTDDLNASKSEQKSRACGKAKANKDNLNSKEDKESCNQEEDIHSSSDESTHRRSLGTARLICPEPCSYFYGNDGDESEDEDYIPSEEWKKEVKVGPMFQAETPAGLCKYEDNEKVYENDDQLLWNPELLPEIEVVEYLAEASKRTGDETAAEVVSKRPLIKDNEQALYELVKSNFNKEEALSKLKCDIKPTKEELFLWTEEEHEDFEQRAETCGDDNSEKANKQIKLWRRKPSLHPGVLNSTDRLLSDTVSVEVSQAVTCHASSSCNADSQSTEWLLSCGTDNTGDCTPTNGSSHSLLLNTTDQQFHSSTKPDTSSSSRESGRCLVRQREDEEDSESPLKRPKTEVEFIMAAAVSGNRMKAV